MSGLVRFRGRIAALGAVIAVLLAAGFWVALTHASAQSTQAAGHSAGHASAVSSSKPKGPLTIVSATPAAHAKYVNGAAPVKVQFSAPLAAGSPMPTIEPAIAGSWSPTGTDAVQFVPASGFGQWTHVAVRIPGGSTGVQSTDGQQLSQSATLHFQVGGYAPARLAELLAQLGYLPVSWTPDSGQVAPALGSTAGQLSAAYAPPAGTFAWAAGYPSGLKSFWDAGSPSGLIVHGAVMAFESDHGLAMDGVAGPQVWQTLLTAAAKDQVNTHGYSYALASQHPPETLTVWHDGHVILHTAANTGIPVAPTAVGTDPVYLRYQTQIMRGTNPDGSKYADPVAWVAYFLNGEAVHYFPRASYGFQQSLGCVELPWAQAKAVWPYLTYGTLVTVTPT
ncbi:MAG TPA: L,D-transpeptidase family protein [Streptosporangiaceae bacterium]|nr:L,D-transpeptidase family protein [Streptosporangiaceae bacterium]